VLFADGPTSNENDIIATRRTHEECTMANWTPMTLQIDGPVSQDLAEKLVAAMSADRMMLPNGMNIEEELVEALVGDQGTDEIEWEDAGTSNFSPKAEALLQEAGLPFSHSERDGLEGPGTKWTWSPETGYSSEEIEGYEWEAEQDDEDEDDPEEMPAP